MSRPRHRPQDGRWRTGWRRDVKAQCRASLRAMERTVRDWLRLGEADPDAVPWPLPREAADRWSWD